MAGSHARIRKGTKTKPWPEIVRKRIQAAMIEKRLLGHIDGSLELSKTQVTVGLGLLKKVLPDLASFEHTGADGTPLSINIVRFSADDHTPK
jgi:hypothetical protein